MVFIIQVISQLSESGRISSTTRDEIETFLLEICVNVSESHQTVDYPRLTQFANETDCAEAVRSVLDRIPKSSNSTSSPDSLRCCMLNILENMLLANHLVMSVLSCLTEAG